MSELNFSLSTVKPVIREAANMNNDGGGGNLGYMQQRKKKQQNREYLDESIFGKKEEDIFMSEKNLKYEEEQGSVSKFFGGLLDKLKNI